MKCLFHKIALAICLTAAPASLLIGSNQTDALSPVLPATSLPFIIELDTASFSLPTGLQSYASAMYQGQWILLAGRTNGLHSFDPVGNNFPPQYQNTTVYVVNPLTGITVSRSLTTSDLPQNIIDTLSVVASEFFQKGKTLYVVGGYGIDTSTSLMKTKNTLTAIDLEKLIVWVENGSPNLSTMIRQTSDSFLQVTGGALFQNSENDPFLLIFGQNFTGLYTDSSNGFYTQQIRSFRLNDDGENLSIHHKRYKKSRSDYRRRDLNIVPIMQANKAGYMAFAGVFTLDNGVWTVPVRITPKGRSYEPKPSNTKTFKQAMNHYNCPTIGLYSQASKDMYTIFPGGLSYGYFSNGNFSTDSEIPFINQITTVKIDKHNQFTQHLMNNEYPYIVSTGSNPGNQLLFGAEAQFFPTDVPAYKNGVIQLDHLPSTPTIIGYIVGGIMSTVPNTTLSSDSTSSPYIFTVTLTKQ